VTGGRLHYANDSLPKNVVIMRIAEMGDLKGFLADKDHTRLRMKLFVELAKTNTELREVLTAHKVWSVEDLARLGSKAMAVYEAIEAAAGLWRIDLQDDEMLEELVESAPLEF
jgi:hypothetical protein